jgi:hypothetical protein
MQLVTTPTSDLTARTAHACTLSTDAPSPLLLAGGIRDTVIDLVNSPAVLAVPVILGFTVASALAGLIYFLSQPVESD